MSFKGSCHCGRIAFDVEGDIEQVIECNCTHCRRMGYLLWFVPRDKLKLHTPEHDMATYTFNKQVIRHHFCPKCGAAPFGFGTNANGEPTAAINIRCLDDVDLAAVRRVPFDGLSI